MSQQSLVSQAAGRSSFLNPTFSLLALLSVGAHGAQICTPTTFSFPELFGLQALSIQASPVQNYTSYPQTVPESLLIRGGLDFCNVTVAYTHVGQNDTINVQVWLPAADQWDGRYVSIGGSGFGTGNWDGDYMAAHTYAKSVAATTDGGHINGEFNASWLLKSPGNLDYNLLNDFALNTLVELPKISKVITSQYYGRPQNYSYWDGCSMGGRQGHQMAQSDPDSYDGILANAPAISWNEMAMAPFWPQVVMNKLGEFPPPCEFNATITAAIEACDDIDGVHDGIISRPDLCTFNPQSLVNKTFSCDGKERTYSAAVAAAANAVWQGSPLLSSGQRDWIGLPIGSPLQKLDTTLAFANTACDADNQHCQGQPCPLFVNGPQYMARKDPYYNPSGMTEEEYKSLLHTLRQQYKSLFGTDDADLGPFKRAGGKLMTFHGLTDNVLSARTTIRYVESVKEGDKDYQNYFRFFEAPGVEHCGGGVGPYWYEGFNKLVKWVEQGEAPETIQALDQTSMANGDQANANQRLLCLYPKVAKFNGGDLDKSASYSCVDTPGGASARPPLNGTIVF